MRTLDLFSGIGGGALGLQRAGLEIVALCEKRPYRQAVLHKHWPDVPIYDDVRTLNARRLHNDGITSIELIAGGFPCKQTSKAAAVHGRRVGLDGEDSGLWWEFERLVREVRPLWVVVENPPGVEAWAGEIQGSLERLGYAVSRPELSAEDCGAPHPRRRLFFVANLDGPRLEVTRFRDALQDVEGPWSAPAPGFWREDKPGVWRMDNGLPHRLERIDALGDAIMPQQGEALGRAILRAQRELALAA